MEIGQWRASLVRYNELVVPNGNIWIRYPMRILSRLTGRYLDSGEGVRKYGFGNGWLHQRRLKFKPLMWPVSFLRLLANLVSTYNISKLSGYRALIAVEVGFRGGE